MFSIRHLPHVAGATVCLAVLVALPTTARAQGQPQTQPSSGEVALRSTSVQLRDLARQLGVTLRPDAPVELNVGATMTATVQEPEKLERFGIVGMHQGARLTVFRASPQRVIVEVDELEPQPITKRATVRIDASGRLIAP
jgi:hypothetical protein